MDLRKEEMPATLQAYELLNDKEVFLAEQIVNSQAEVETFTSRYAGKLIKATRVTQGETRTHATPPVKKERSSTGLVMFIIVLILAALIVYGFSTGWIQEKFNLNI